MVEDEDNYHGDRREGGGGGVGGGGGGGGGVSVSKMQKYRQHGKVVRRHILEPMFMYCSVGKPLTDWREVTLFASPWARKGTYLG